MSIQKIRTKDATYQKFEVLLTNRNKRHRYQEFIVEGVRNINEVIANNWQISAFIYQDGKKLSDWATDLLQRIKTDVNYELTEHLMNDLSGKEDASELIAIVKMKEHIKIKMSENPLIALFDRPSNKGNLGTLLRSCDALGIEQLIITGHSVDIYDPDVIVASMGSFFKVPFVKLADKLEIEAYLNQLKTDYPSLKIVGTTVDPTITIYDVDMRSPILFLIGNETHGLNRYYAQISDVMATIPMSETASASSFNVSCAATVVFYEAIRQRKLVKEKSL